MIVIDNPAVRADWHIDSCFFKVFITGFGYFDDSRCLTAANPLLFTGNADGAAANTNLDEIGTRFSQEAEPFLINNVAGTNLHLVAILVTNPLEGPCLPFTESFGRIDAKDISTSFDKGWNTLFIIPGVDPAPTIWRF